MDKKEMVFKLNEKYQRAMSTIIQLSTGALIVPIVFIRNMFSITEEKPIREFVNWFLLASWVAFVMSIIFGCLYLAISPKYVQSKTESDESEYEVISDWTYRLAMGLFLLGIILFGIFAFKIYFRT